MFEIDEDIIKITRGDRAVIELEVEDDFYFEAGDKIRFSVYEKKQYEKEAVLEKNIEIAEKTNKVVIELTSEDTTIGELKSTVDTYWYEIEYNDNITIKGYDDDGAKLFKLYPEGREN